ncbi:unnamed protein product [Prorocentrum cordatum]|uniref:Secreted protein n=1 Tax=Prorocentrum cordatum TaxID=2364126 RepID=A0ABN9RX76_9DINO|nr:unnamed protein product [Polarella glacialis]
MLILISSLLVAFALWARVQECMQLTFCAQASCVKFHPQTPLSVQRRRGESLAYAARQVLTFFSYAGCQTEAMLNMGNLLDGVILVCLEAVLKPEPARRASASDMAWRLSARRTEQASVD